MSQLELIEGQGSYQAGARDDLDYYPTPPELLGPLLTRWGVLRSKQRIIEPCAGRALSLARVLQSEDHEVLTADIDPLAPVDMHVDVLEHDWGQYNADVILTNPPYLVGDMHAADVIRALLPHVKWGVFLLRTTFKEPCANRLDLVTGDGAPVRVITNPRVSFRGKGTDTTTTSWFIWRGAKTRYQRMPRRGWYGETVHPTELERWRIRFAERGLL